MPCWLVSDIGIQIPRGLLDTLGNCEQGILSKVAFIPMSLPACNSGSHQIYGRLLDISYRADGVPFVEMLNPCETIYLDED